MGPPGDSGYCQCYQVMPRSKGSKFKGLLYTQVATTLSFLCGAQVWNCTVQVFTDLDNTSDALELLCILWLVYNTYLVFILTESTFLALRVHRSLS